MSNLKCGLGFYLFKDTFLSSENAPMHQNTICTRLRKYEFDKLAIYLYSDGLIIISPKNMVKEDFWENVNNLAKHVFCLNLVALLLYATSLELTIDFPESNSIFLRAYECSPINALKLSSEDNFLTVLRHDFNYHNTNSAQYRKCFEPNYFPEYKRPIESIDKFMIPFCDKVEVALKSDELAHLIVILQESIIAYTQIKLDVSSALSWLVIERVLQQMWKKYIAEKKRAAALKNNRDYTVSIKSNILLTAGEIDKKLFDCIDDARKQRNKIMHGNYNLFSDNLVNDFEKSSWESIMTVCLLIQRYYAFRLELRPGIYL